MVWNIGGVPGPDSGIPVPYSKEQSANLFVPRDQIIRTPKRLAYGQLTNANATLYTAPAVVTPTGSTQGCLLKSITLTNTDTAQRTVTLYKVESGGSAAANRMLLSALPIPAGYTLVISWNDEGNTLNSGETIQGLADVTLKVTYDLNGVELT